MTHSWSATGKNKYIVMIREKREARNHTFSGVHPKKNVTPRPPTKFGPPFPPQKTGRGRPCACPVPRPNIASPIPLKDPVGAGLVPAQVRRQVPPSHLTLLAPKLITRFFEQLRGSAGIAELTVLCVSADADLVRQDYGRACQIRRARIPNCVREPGPDQLCEEYLLHAPTRP